jgi:hypothetical protein
MPYDAQHALEHPETAGWALGALDPDDAAAFEEHRQSCPQCQEQAAEFVPVARSLTLAAPADIPPPDLLSKTLAAVRNAALAEGSAEPGPEPESRPGFDVPQQHPESRRPAAGDQAPTWIFSIAQHQRPALDETPVHLSNMARPRAARDDALAAVIDLPWWRRHRGRLTSAVAVAAVLIVAAIVVLPRLGGGQSTVVIPLQATTAAKLNGVAAASGQAAARQADQSWTYVLTVRGLKPLHGNDFYECWYAAPAAPPATPSWSVAAPSLSAAQDRPPSQ